MRKMTESNLLAAFAGESQAHMKYAAFAERARKDGFPNLARLFEATSYAERVHAINHLRELDGIHASVDNLHAAVNGETGEVVDMYPAFRAVAELEGEKGAVRSINYALEAEKVHAALYSQAKNVVAGGQDSAAGTVHVCGTCGHTVVGDAPERCPVCGAQKSRFQAF